MAPGSLTITIGTENASKELDILSKTLDHYLAEGSLYLRVSKPAIKYLPTFSVDKLEAGYDHGKHKILLSVCPSYLKLSQLALPITAKSNEEALVFILFHELGHHWHRTSHLRHWFICEGEYKPLRFCTLEEYTAQRIEKIADRVAGILFRELYLNNKRGKNGRAKFLSY